MSLLSPSQPITASASGRESDDASNLRLRPSARGAAESSPFAQHTARDALIDAVRTPRYKSNYLPLANFHVL